MRATLCNDTALEQTIKLNTLFVVVPLFIPGCLITLLVEALQPSLIGRLGGSTKII